MSDSSSSSEEEYFNLHKPRKKVVLPPQGRKAKEERLAKLQSTDDHWQTDALDNAEPQYYLAIQRQERERMAQGQAQIEETHSGIFPSALSQFEVDTIGNSSVHNATISSKKPPDNLRAKFDMDRSADINLRSLPVFKCANDLLAKIDAHCVTVVSGATGCGKSTQVPQFLLDQFAAQDKYVNIIVTQPRKLAAQALARRVAEERGWRLGGLIGYKVGLDKENASKDTRLMFVTTGLLIKMLIAKKSMAEWTHIIIDEVHERDKDIDFLLLLSRKFLTSNSPGCKIILMSATLNPEKLCSYYSWPFYPMGPPVQQASYFEITGQMHHHVAVFYLEEILEGRRGHDFKAPEERPALYPDCVNECRKMVFNGIKRLDKKEKEKGAVLIFLPGEFEIATMIKSFKAHDPDNNEKLIFFPLHSRMPFEDTKKIFDTVPDGYRKIIISTNMAESSVTIPDISFVIDFCLTKKLVCDPSTNYSSLQLVWTDKNSCEQRKGRAGRVRSGRVYRLVFRDFYNRVLLDEENLVEMQRAPLDKIILDTKILDMGPPKELLALALDPPDLRNIKNTVLHLKDMGALLPTVSAKNPDTGEIERNYSKEDGDLTVLGQLVSSMPIDVRLGKLVIFGHLFNVLEESIIVAAGLSTKSIFAFPFDKKEKAYANKLLWSNKSFSDCLAVLLAYQVWKDKVNTGFFFRKSTNELTWCKERFLQMKALKELDMTVKEIRSALERFQIKEIHLPNRTDRMNMRASDNNYLLLKVAIFGAFYPNYLITSHGQADLREAHKVINDRDPMSTLYMTGFPSDQSQFGQLYASQIKEIFRDSQPNKEMISLEFDHTKVIVEFRPHRRSQEVNACRLGDLELSRQTKNLTLNINHHVYVGLKLRGQKELNLYLYSIDEADKQWRKHQEAVRRLSEANKSREVTVAEAIGQVDPPRVEVSEVKVEVTHVNHPNSFWVVYNDRETLQKQQEVHEAIDIWLKYAQDEPSCLVQHLKHVIAGNVYLAPFNDEYYRARVDAVDECSNYVTVFFMDFGNSDSVMLEELIVLSRKGLTELGENVMPLIKIPALAIECSLALIRPNPIRSNPDEWAPEATRAFEKMLQRPDQEGKKVIAEIHSTSTSGFSPLLTVMLFHTMNDCTKRTSINKQFLELVDDKGRPYVEPTQEYHRTHRLDISFQSEWRRMKEERQRHRQYFGSSSFQDSQVHHMEKGQTQIQLRGPYHPLEYKLNPIHMVGSQWLVRVEPESVNSVLLDDQPDEAVDQFMVAAHIGLNPSGRALMVRATTLMPNKLCLGALLTMIFAPNVEMRVDRSMRRYTGCLAGLGYSTQNEVAYNSDHDMEIPFDGVITNADLMEINRIRFYINSALSRDLRPNQDIASASLKISGDNAVVNHQDKIRDSLDKLLFKPRLPKTKEPTSDPGKWGKLTRMPKAKLEKKSIDDTEFSYKWIQGANLSDDYLDRCDEIIEALRSIKRYADQQSQFSYGDSIACPICPAYSSISTSAEARAHLNSFEHKESLELLKEQINKD